MDKKTEVPYLKYVYYDQWRSEELWLNHTLSIIMNYFAFVLPLWGDSVEHLDRKFYWMNRNKLLWTLPTLSIGNATLKSHISKLVTDWLLERHIVTKEGEKSRWFYRATNIYTKGEKTRGMKFPPLYNEIEILLKEWKLNSTEKDKLSKLLSSYSGKSKKSSTTFNLEDVGGTDIFNYLKQEFELSEKWEWVELNVGEEINKDWVIENIINPIKVKGELHWWIQKDQAGRLDINDEIKGKILSKLQTMFQWHKDNKTAIKSMKGKINTFFWKSWI